MGEVGGARAEPVRVLVLAGERTPLQSIDLALRADGCEVVVLDSAFTVLRRVAGEALDVALLDASASPAQLPALELLEAVKRRKPGLEVVLVVDDASPELARAAAQAGAYDCLARPIAEGEQVARTLARAAERGRLLGRIRALEGALRAPQGGPASPGAPPEATTPAEGECGISYARAKEHALRLFEQAYVEAQLSACSGNISAAARRAGMDRSNFKRLLRKYRRDAEADACPDDDLAIG